MGFDRTPYKCPICGKWCSGVIAFRKHYNSCESKQQAQAKQNRGG